MTRGLSRGSILGPLAVSKIVPKAKRYGLNFAKVFLMVTIKCLDEKGNVGVKKDNGDEFNRNVLRAHVNTLIKRKFGGVRRGSSIKLRRKEEKKSCKITNPERNTGYKWSVDVSAVVEKGRRRGRADFGPVSADKGGKPLEII